MRILAIILLTFQSLIAEVSPGALIDDIIISTMKQKDIPGIAVALYYDGKGYIFCYGVADREKNKAITADTIFEIASITKVFTSTDLALQVEHGTMSLNNRLTRYLPSIDKSKGAINQVTLEQLATHTSSLPRSLPPGKEYNRPMVDTFLQNWQPMYPIGTRYVYSNLGFGLLGNALENVENKSYEQLIRDDITKSLEMDSTMVNVPAAFMDRFAQGYSREGELRPQWQDPFLPGGWALRSTASDMLKFLKANLGVGKPTDLLKAMQLAQKGYYKVNNNLTIGLGWQRVHVNDLLFIDKNGGLPGFSSYIGMIPEKGIGLVILANKTKIESTPLGRRILGHLSDR
jgi:beta-lactamase class C